MKARGSLGTSILSVLPEDLWVEINVELITNADFCNDSVIEDCPNFAAL